MKTFRTATIAGTAIAAVFAADVSSASAQTLMDLLFKRRTERQQREIVPVAPPPPVRRAAPPRVSGPAYYTYKTDPLVEVDFAAIAPERDEAAGEAIDDGTVASTAAVKEEGALSSVGSLPTALKAPAIPAPPMLEALPTAVEGAQLPGAPMLDALPTAIEGTDGALPAAGEQTRGPDPLTDEQIAGLQDYALMAEKEAADALIAHYSGVPEMIWVADGRPNDKARAALRVLGDAASHGLDPRDYAVSVPPTGDDAAAARFEMELSARILRYASDARSGRIDPNRISGYHDFNADPVDLVAVLQGARDTDDVAAFLEAEHPRNPQYRALRVELEVLRASAENEIVIAPGTLIRPGESNAELPKIVALIEQRADAAFRETHREALDQHRDSEAYVQALVPVVKDAQRMAGVGVDGVIGPRTIQAIAGESKAGRIAKVEYALEQLRWLPSDFGDRHVFINTPAFNATYVEDGKPKLSMRTIVGGLSTQTYFFKDEIEYVEFHPYWGVPRSILINKYLPKLYSDPGYLDRAGFEVTNSRGQRIPSSSVNWGQYGSKIPYDVRQRPGRSNALGELKIMFPNKHAIYMHDTPDKNLFQRDNRALSNGCIRLADPRAMAAAVLGWDRGRVDNRLDGQHGRENLATKVPVYVGYFTAWPDEAGRVGYYNDVYSRDEKTRAALEKVAAVRGTGA